MTSMMGGGAPQEDLFAKLESMRAVINEVNQQFTDPVRPPPPLFIAPLPFKAAKKLTANPFWAHIAGQDDVRLRRHLRVSQFVRDGAARAGVDKLRD